MNTTERIPSNYKRKDTPLQIETIDSPRNQNNENNSQLQNIIAPFGSLTDKSSIIPKYLDSNPGPGAYDLLLENRNQKNSNPANICQSYDNILKNFFITREERFKEKQNNISVVGDYDLINIKNYSPSN